MTCRVRDAGSISIVEVDGIVDINSADIVETIGWLMNIGKRNILCNLENADMVDYGGLSVLAITYKNVINHNGKMKFLNVPLPVMELMRVVRLDMVFECYYDEAAALNSFIEETEVSRMPLRRRFKRLDIHFKVKYKLVGTQAKPAVFEGEVLNISGSGLFIYTKNTFPINSPLSLELRLPDAAEGKTIEVLGKVVWLPDKELQPHSYPGMGISFTRVDRETERVIVDFVEKNVTYRAE
jgi:anti-anti-sigma factor